MVLETAYMYLCETLKTYRMAKGNRHLKITTQATLHKIVRWACTCCIQERTSYGRRCSQFTQGCTGRAVIFVYNQCILARQAALIFEGESKLIEHFASKDGITMTSHSRGIVISYIYTRDICI